MSQWWVGQKLWQGRVKRLSFLIKIYGSTVNADLPSHCSDGAGELQWWCFANVRNNSALHIYAEELILKLILILWLFWTLQNDILSALESSVCTLLPGNLSDMVCNGFFVCVLFLFLGSNVCTLLPGNLSATVCNGFSLCVLFLFLGSISFPCWNPCSTF